MVRSLGTQMGGESPQLRYTEGRGWMDSAMAPKRPSPPPRAGDSASIEGIQVPRDALAGWCLPGGQAQWFLLFARA